MLECFATENVQVDFLHQHGCMVYILELRRWFSSCKQYKLKGSQVWYQWSAINTIIPKKKYDYWLSETDVSSIIYKSLPVTESSELSIAFLLISLLLTTQHKAVCKWTASRLLFWRQRGYGGEQQAPAFNPRPNRKCSGVAMQLCSTTARTLGSLLTNDVWWGQYGKPFEQALQKLYSKNRSMLGWKREWEGVIVCPWLQSGVGFTAPSPSFLSASPFLHSNPFVSLCLSLPAFVPHFLSPTFPPSMTLSFLHPLLVLHLLP